VIQSLTCPDSLKSAITRYASSLQELVGEDLLGIYLYGSVARGCYHPAQSDVDVIAVVRDGWEEVEEPSLIETHNDSGLPIDAVVVTESQLQVDAFPTPVVLLVKPISGHTIVRAPDGSKDFLLQRQDTYEAGMALIGPDPKELIHPVPWPLLAESLNFLFPHIVPNFKNPVLMLSRIACAWETRRLCSKREAGEWAVESIGEPFIDMLKTALVEYADGVSHTAIARKKIEEFAALCLQRRAKT
jgi:predicted nucleotidyltransferase